MYFWISNSWVQLQQKKIIPTFGNVSEGCLGLVEGKLQFIAREAAASEPLVMSTYHQYEDYEKNNT